MKTPLLFCFGTHGNEHRRNSLRHIRFFSNSVGPFVEEKIAGGRMVIIFVEGIPSANGYGDPQLLVKLADSDWDRFRAVIGPALIRDHNAYFKITQSSVNSPKPGAILSDWGIAAVLKHINFRDIQNLAITPAELFTPEMYLKLLRDELLRQGIDYHELPEETAIAIIKSFIDLNRTRDIQLLKIISDLQSKADGVKLAFVVLRGANHQRMVALADEHKFDISCVVEPTLPRTFLSYALFMSEDALSRGEEITEGQIRDYARLHKRYAEYSVYHSVGARLAFMMGHLGFLDIEERLFITSYHKPAFNHAIISEPEAAERCGLSVI